MAVGAVKEENVADEMANESVSAPAVDLSKKLFKCNICNRNYEHKSTLERHIKKKHSDGGEQEESTERYVYF